MKKQIPILALLMILLVTCTQQVIKVAVIEENLLATRQQYLDSAYQHNDYSDSLANKFSSELMAILGSVGATFDHPFDSLKRKVSIQNSPDDLLRTYSWYHLIGEGTWHDIRSIAQYKTENGIDTLSLSSGKEWKTGEPTGVTYTKIQILREGADEIYLLSGWGTYGGGHHHRIMRALQVQDNKLVNLAGLFNGERYLTVWAPRGNKISLIYDEKAQSITYDLFEKNEDIGFYRATGKQIRLTWNGKEFK